MSQVATYKLTTASLISLEQHHAFLYDPVNVVKFVNVQSKFVTAVVIDYGNYM